MPRKKITKREILVDLQSVFNKLRIPFTSSEYDKYGKYSSSTVISRFGNWGSALEEANLKKRFDEIKKAELEIKNWDEAKHVQDEYSALKEKLIEKAKINEHKRLKRMKAATDIIMERLETATAKIPQAIIEINHHPKPVPIGDKGRCILWFDISDCQLGTLVVREKTGGLNEHNWKIWKKKLRRWTNEVRNIIQTSQYEGWNIDSVVLAQLGDMVEGHGIFPTQAYKMDQDVYYQMLYGSEDLSQAYLELAHIFPDITFHLEEVAGNHGRVGRRGEAPFHVNFDCIMYEYIRLRLDSHQLSNFKYKRNVSWYKIVQTYDWKHLLVHGDKGMGNKWGGKYTINSLEKADAKYQKMLNMVLHYVHMGHYHADASFSDSRGEKIINGNWIGGTDYAADIVEANTPLQKGYLITPINGIERVFKIHLEKRRDGIPQIDISKVKS